MGRFAGRYGNKSSHNGARGAKEAMYLRGFRKARKIVPNTCTNGEVKVIKPADPEKVKAWRESPEYAKYQQNLQRWRG